MEILITFHGSIFLVDSRSTPGRILHQLHQLTSLQDLMTHYSLIPNVKVSVNGELITDFNQLVNEGDEIHFFRPVSGGWDFYIIIFAIQKIDRYRKITHHGY